jgi:drug/metabolite transporter (DMT)-like permease
MLGSLENIFLNGILIAIIAHGLIGLSLVWDKVLLQRKGTQNLLAYVFWLGIISIFGLVLIAFGFHFRSWGSAGIAFLGGVLDLVASYFYYAALKSGEASEELTAMGGFTPVATVLFSLPFFAHPVGGAIAGFVLMTIGGFVMFLAEKKPLGTMLPKLLIASVCFGWTNVLQKLAFNADGFITGYVFFTLGTTIGAAALLVPPSWRRQIFQSSEGAPPKSKFWYGVNRFLAGVGSFLVVYAVSRASPAIVQAISGVRYVVIFLGAYLITLFRPMWFREDFSRRTLVLKIVATGLILAGLVIVGLGGGDTSGGGA